MEFVSVYPQWAIWIRIDEKWYIDAIVILVSKLKLQLNLCHFSIDWHSSAEIVGGYSKLELRWLQHRNWEYACDGLWGVFHLTIFTWLPTVLAHFNHQGSGCPMAEVFLPKNWTKIVPVWYIVIVVFGITIQIRTRWLLFRDYNLLCRGKSGYFTFANLQSSSLSHWHPW